MTKKRVIDFLEAVDRRFFKFGPEEGASLQIDIYGSTVELRFLTREHAETVTSYLLFPVLKEYREPDSIFYYWTEDCKGYIPADASDQKGIWQGRDETGYFRIIPDFEMIGFDYVRNRYYHCRVPEDYDDYVIHGHSMAPTFSRWALRNGYLLLHSACVGMEGKGVMISARGGGGKSTLAVSCLLDGFDFVSDDYILVNQKGPMFAKPLYKIIGLNQDMAAILKPDMPIVRTEPRRGNKLYLDAGGYEIKKELPVQAVIYPNPCKAETPLLRRTSPGPVLTKVMETSARNMRVFRETEPYRLMAARLKDLPVYEFLLTEDLNKNREYLKEFIIKELSNVQVK